MIDIKLVNSDFSTDLGIVANDLETEEGLRTAVLISLFSDARADADEMEAGDTDRRGWWGDMVAAVSGDQLGSKLWLLERSKQTPDVLDKAQEYAEEALQWMIDDNVADSINVETEFSANGFLKITVGVTKPKSTNLVYTFDYAWAAELAA